VSREGTDEMGETSEVGEKEMPETRQGKVRDKRWERLEKASDKR
jgi:hypothetical protein